MSAASPIVPATSSTSSASPRSSSAARLAIKVAFRVLWKDSDAGHHERAHQCPLPQPTAEACPQALNHIGWLPWAGANNSSGRRDYDTWRGCSIGPPTMVPTDSARSRQRYLAPDTGLMDCCGPAPARHDRLRESNRRSACARLRQAMLIADWNVGLPLVRGGRHGRP